MITISAGRLPKRFKNRLINPLLSRQTRAVADKYRIAGEYKRVYHYHIRKTAGTSLNSAFWNLAGLGMSDTLFTNFVNEKGYIFVRNNKKMIEVGRYFFADSHIPAHEMNIPAQTFTITVLRNPLDRIMSYYRYLLWARDSPNATKQDPTVAFLSKEMRWLGGSFGDFVENLPRQHLLNQLYMFSRDFSVEEAVGRIAACSYVARTSTFANDVAHLGSILQLPLALKWERRFGRKIMPTATELSMAARLLSQEFEMLSLLQRAKAHCSVLA